MHGNGDKRVENMYFGEERYQQKDLTLDFSRFDISFGGEMRRYNR